MRAPVSRFVGVVAVIATVLLLAAWTGAAAPAIAAHDTGEGTEADGQTGYLVATMENTGSLPVDVQDIRWRSGGLTGTEILVGPVTDPPAGARPFAPFSLEGGETRSVILRGRISCPLPGDVVTVATDPLVVRAKPAAGPARTLTLDLRWPGQETARTLPCPGR